MSKRIYLPEEKRLRKDAKRLYKQWRKMCITKVDVMAEAGGKMVLAIVAFKEYSE